MGAFYASDDDEITALLGLQVGQLNSFLPSKQKRGAHESLTSPNDTITLPDDMARTTGHENNQREIRAREDRRIPTRDDCPAIS